MDELTYAYSHGGNAAFERGDTDSLDLSANINPLGMPEGVRGAIIGAIPDCARYPDSASKELREKIAAFETVAPERIFCGNGASDIIFRLPMALRAKKALVAAPTFADYERAARASGCVVVRHALRVESGFALDDGFAQAVRREKPDIVFLCNPNNPTGVLAERGVTAEILDCCRDTGALLVADECFMDFAEQAEVYTCRAFLERGNLVILKAFTKIFALPGIRLGYALCADTALVERLYFHGADWPVSNLAQAAGLAVLENADGFIHKTAAYVAEQRAALQDGLAGLGYKTFASRANYVFFQSPYPFDLREALYEKGICIRACSNFPGLDKSYYRAAVSTEANNSRLLNGIAAATKPYMQNRI